MLTPGDIGGVHTPPLTQLFKDVSDTRIKDHFNLSINKKTGEIALNPIKLTGEEHKTHIEVFEQAAKVLDGSVTIKEVDKKVQKTVKRVVKWARNEGAGDAKMGAGIAANILKGFAEYERDRLEIDARVDEMLEAKEEAVMKITSNEFFKNTAKYQHFTKDNLNSIVIGISDLSSEGSASRTATLPQDYVRFIRGRGTSVLNKDGEDILQSTRDRIFDTVAVKEDIREAFLERFALPEGTHEAFLETGILPEDIREEFKAMGRFPKRSDYIEIEDQELGDEERREKKIVEEKLNAFLDKTHGRVNYEELSQVLETMVDHLGLKTVMYDAESSLGDIIINTFKAEVGEEPAEVSPGQALAVLLKSLETNPIFQEEGKFHKEGKALRVGLNHFTQSFQNSGGIAEILPKQALGFRLKHNNTLSKLEIAMKTDEDGKTRVTSDHVRVFQNPAFDESGNLLSLDEAHAVPEHEVTGQLTYKVHVESDSEGVITATNVSSVERPIVDDPAEQRELDLKANQILVMAELCKFEPVRTIGKCERTVTFF